MDKKALERERVTELYKKYDLTENDVFKHQNYLIISRSGIEKIQAKGRIAISFETVAINLDGTFACIKATATKGKEVLESYGSAKRGGKEFITIPGQTKKKFVEHGNTETWYIAEMAEKRAKSRVVLQMEGLYKEGVFGEDESDDFKEKKTSTGVSSAPDKASPPAKKAEPVKAEPVKAEPTKVAPEETAIEKQLAEEVPVVNPPSKDNTAPAHTVEDAVKVMTNSATIDELKLGWQLIKDWGYGLNDKVIAAKNAQKANLLK